MIDTCQPDTYNSRNPFPVDGSRGIGGWASHIRAHEYFVFKIPDQIPSHEVAPMLCAGITTYSPLVRAGVGPGKKVAILGIGGLGHLAIQWANALGAEVYALTHSPNKVESAQKLGAKKVIVTTEENWDKDYKFFFDYILNCSDATHKMDVAQYMSTLKIGADFHLVGLGDEPLPTLPATCFVNNGAKITGSHLGNNQEMNAMLKLAAEKNVRAVVQTIDISEDGCKEAVERMKKGGVHYRLTLTGFDKAFGFPGY